MKVWRIVLGVIGGYVALVIVVFTWAFLLVPRIWPELAMVDGEFPGAPADHPEFKWELGVNVIAGLGAGLTCSLIAGAGRMRAAMILVALMVLLSIPALFRTDLKPLWATLAAPITGGLGIFAVVYTMSKRALAQPN